MLFAIPAYQHILKCPFVCRTAGGNLANNRVLWPISDRPRAGIFPVPELALIRRSGGDICIVRLRAPMPVVLKNELFLFGPTFGDVVVRGAIGFAKVRQWREPCLPWSSTAKM